MAVGSVVFSVTVCVDDSVEFGEIVYVVVSLMHSTTSILSSKKETKAPWTK